MPQLVKGGKWVFGWTVVGSGGGITIPPEAWEEYRFQVGDEVTFIAGSRRSGGFGLSHPRLLVGSALLLESRMLGKGWIGESACIVAPAATGVQPGDPLLVVRGSGRALGFIARGPIYDEAAKHPELACFDQESER
ncbi:MAG: hypothetical protein JXA93_11885 [Anaerolineae bacterium]|nr:hypothetical protein [Anaerolineae bacterium]